MKVFLSLVLIFSGLSFTAIEDVSAQTRPTANQARTAQVRVPARINQRDRAVTVIKPTSIKRTANLSLEAVSPNNPRPMNVQSRAPRPNPPGGMGSIQVNPPGKLNVTLTAKKPSIEHRAYLSYQYPQSVAMNENSNHIVYSKGNIPGSLNYTVKLDKDKKYLIEIMADPWGTSGGKVQHKIGDETTIHEFGKFNEKINISRVVMPEENGWVGGWLAQSSPAAGQWRVYSVSITEMD